MINSLIYNADGMRAQKADSAGITNYIWDGRNSLRDERDWFHSVGLYDRASYIWQNHLAIAERGTVDFLFDALGSTRQLANSSRFSYR